MSDRGRLHVIDLWRTCAIACMITYHFLYDLWSFGYVARDFLQLPGSRFFQLFSSLSFMALAGISSHLSRSNLKRGVYTLAAALLVSIVTAFMGQPVVFGILHFLAVCMLLYAALGKYIRKLPGIALPVICLELFFITDYWTQTVVESKMLFIFGFRYPGFYSSDYYPLLPWIFVFLFGTWLGTLIKKHDGADWLYAKIPAALTWPGRHSMIIYLLHQPVLYAGFYIYSMFN